MSDERLRARFRALRETELNEAPLFERSLARAEASRGDSSSLWRCAPIAAAALAAWLIFVLPSSPPKPAPLDPGPWAMPTDVLLEVPGGELLRDLPDIGIDFDGPASLGTERNKRTIA